MFLRCIKSRHSQISVWKPMASLYVWYERMSFQAPDWPPPCCGGTLPGGLTMPRPAHVAVERLIWPCRRKAAMLVTACVWWRLRCCWWWWRLELPWRAQYGWSMQKRFKENKMPGKKNMHPQGAYAICIAYYMFLFFLFGCFGAFWKACQGLIFWEFFG